MKYKEFDYYVFIDYSENLIGYNILGKDKLKELLPKISKFRHYRTSGNKRLYIKNVKKTFERENLKSYFLRFKVSRISENMSLYSDIFDFLKKHENCIVFISVDNHQYPAFKKMIEIIDGDRVVVKRESELVVGTPEYQISLILDNWLNIERLSNES